MSDDNNDGDVEREKCGEKRRDQDKTKEIFYA
jgi:hypothetical protein